MGLPGDRPELVHYEHSSSRNGSRNGRKSQENSNSRSARARSEKSQQNGQAAPEQNGQAAPEQNGKHHEEELTADYSQEQQPGPGRKRMGPHPFWRRGFVDHLRAFLLSTQFQAGVQTSTGALRCAAAANTLSLTSG